MELANGPRPLTLDAGYQAMGVFFLLHGIPLGDKYFNAAELPLTAEQVWEFAIEAILPALTDRILPAAQQAENAVRNLAALDPFEAFGGQLRQQRSAAAPHRISVVICTHERPAALARCLAALRNLENEPFEIIVVDNAPKTGATQELVSEFPNIRYKPEPRRGLSYARNTGVEAARGDIVAFTDDDVVVSENWLTELVRPFDDPSVACATGLVIPAEMENTEQSLFEAWLSFHRGYHPLRFDPEWLRKFRGAPDVWNFGAGANMAIRRSAFDEAGLFDTRLGAGAAGCSEDSELWYRLLASGYACEYVPSSLVLHHHRADRASLANQMRMYTRGHVSALLIQFAQHRNAANLLRILTGLPAYQLRKLAASVLFPEWRPFWLASAKGYFEGLLYLLRNRKNHSRDMRAASLKQQPVAALSARESHGDQ